MKGKVDLIGLFSFLILFCVMTIAQEAKLYYVLLPAELGFGAVTIESQKNLIDELVKYAKRELNVDVKVEIKGNAYDYSYRDSWNEIFKEFKAGKDAITLFASPLAYIEGEEMGIPFRPYLSPAIEGNNKISYCLWVNKDSGINKISQLRGKKINAYDNYAGSILVLKQMLVENGIKEDFLDYFSKGIPYQNDGVAFQALIDEKLDCVFTDTVSTKFALKTVYEPDYVVPLMCSKQYTTTPFLGLQEKDPKLTKNVLAIVENIFHNKELKKFAGILQGFGASFTKVNAKDYADWRNLYRTAKKSGWLPGIEKWEKQYVEWLKEAIKAGKIKPKKPK